MDWVTQNLANGICDIETLGDNSLRSGSNANHSAAESRDGRYTGYAPAVLSSQPLLEVGWPKAQHGLLKQHATTDITAEAIKIILRPEKEIPYLHRLKIHVKSSALNKAQMGPKSQEDVVRKLQ